MTHRTAVIAGATGLVGRYLLEHLLQQNDYAAVAAWPCPDYVFGCDYDIISGMGKARRYGFNACVDTAGMFLRLFTRFREQRIMP